MKRNCLDCGKPHDFDKEIYCDCHLRRAISSCRSDIERNNNYIEELHRSIKYADDDNRCLQDEITKLLKREMTIKEG